jgi:hypothetical protein
MSKSTTRPVPSPNGTNHEGLFLEQRIRTRAQLGQDAVEYVDGKAVQTSSDRGAYDAPRRGRGRDDIPPKVERFREDLSSGKEPTEEFVQRASEQGEDDGDFDDFRSFLQDCGMTDDECDRAVEIARDKYRRRSNGHDRRAARDRFPVRSHRGPIADRDAGEAHDYNAETGEDPMRIVDHGLDRRPRHAMDEASQELRRLMDRITIEGDNNPAKVSLLMSDYHHSRTGRRGRNNIAMDRATTEADRERFHKMFPGVERIQQA